MSLASMRLPRQGDLPAQLRRAVPEYPGTDSPPALASAAANLRVPRLRTGPGRHGNPRGCRRSRCRRRRRPGAAAGLPTRPRCERRVARARPGRVPGCADPGGRSSSLAGIRPDSLHRSQRCSPHDARDGIPGAGARRRVPPAMLVVPGCSCRSRTISSCVMARLPVEPRMGSPSQAASTLICRNRLVRGVLARGLRRVHCPGTAGGFPLKWQSWASPRSTCGGCAGPTAGWSACTGSPSPCSAARSSAPGHEWCGEDDDRNPGGLPGP